MGLTMVIAFFLGKLTSWLLIVVLSSILSLQKVFMNSWGLTVAEQVYSHIALLIVAWDWDSRLLIALGTFVAFLWLLWLTGGLLCNLKDSAYSVHTSLTFGACVKSWLRYWTLYQTSWPMLLLRVTLNRTTANLAIASGLSVGILKHLSDFTERSLARLYALRTIRTDIKIVFSSLGNQTATLLSLIWSRGL